MCGLELTNMGIPARGNLSQAATASLQDGLQPYGHP